MERPAKEVKEAAAAAASARAVIASKDQYINHAGGSAVDTVSSETNMEYTHTSTETLESEE